MSSGLIAFLVLAPVVVWLGYAITGWLNYRENPLYRNAMYKMLDIGSVRWELLSPVGEGHSIFVIKDFVKKKRLFSKKERIVRVIFDRYRLKGGKYVLETADLNYSAYDFIALTDAEPVKKEERIK